MAMSSSHAMSLGGGSFFAPSEPRLRGSQPRLTLSTCQRHRVLFSPKAKGQKGVRKVLSNPAEQFAPGSVMGKMMNSRLNKIQWKVLSDAADKLDGELATQPILARNKNP